MPRKPDQSRTAQQARHARWRSRMREQAVPETDAVDSALAVAVAVYADAARTAGKSMRRVMALEEMAVSYLVSRGYALEYARQRVGRRVHRLDVTDLVPLVVGKKPSPGDTQNLSHSPHYSTFLNLKSIGSRRDEIEQALAPCTPTDNDHGRRENTRLEDDA